MRKGVSSILIIFFVIGIGAATLASYITIRSQIATEVLREDVHTLNTVLGLSKEYSETALRYSLYQSCYDTLSSGELPDEDSFRKALEDSMNNMMKTYTGDGYMFSDYSAVLPEYDVKIKGASSDSISLLATGEKTTIHRNYISKTFGNRDISLKSNSTLIGNVATDCWDVYLKAAKASDSITPVLEKAISDAVFPWSSGTFGGEGLSFTKHEDICRAIFVLQNKTSIEDAEKNITEETAKVTLPEGFTLKETGGRISWTFITSEPDGTGTVKASCSFEPFGNATVELKVDGEVEHPVFDSGLKMLKLAAGFTMTAGKA